MNLSLSWLSAGYVGVERYFSLLKVLTKVTNTTNFGGQGHDPIDVHPLKLLRRTPWPPSPGIATHAYDQNSNRKQRVKPGFQPAVAVRNERRFIA